MAEYFGNPLVRISQEWAYDPGPSGGDTIIERWTGTKNAIVGLMNAFRTAGYACRESEEDGKCYLTAIIPLFQTGQTQETPQDAWDINTDFVQEAIWGAPLVIAAAQLVAGSALLPTVEDVIAFWRQSIEAALVGDDGGPKTVKAAGFSGVLASLYKLFLMGTDSREVERAVLTRVRSISAQYADQMVLEADPKVYSTGKLIAVFSIPQYIVRQLPSNPVDKPFATEWAWKPRRNERHVESNGKIQEVREWVFAAWSTILYDFQDL